MGLSRPGSAIAPSAKVPLLLQPLPAPAAKFCVLGVREISTLRAKHQKSSADEKQKAVASIRCTGRFSRLSDQTALYALRKENGAAGRQIDASIETCQTEVCEPHMTALFAVLHGVAGHRWQCVLLVLQLRSLDEDRRQQQLQNGRSGSPLELERAQHYCLCASCKQTEWRNAQPGVSNIILTCAEQVTQLKHNCQLLDQEIRAREQVLTAIWGLFKHCKHLLIVLLTDADALV